MTTEVVRTTTYTHRSVSQYNSFVACPEGFRLEKVERVPRRPAAWTIQGIAVHHAIEKFELSLRHLETDTIRELYFAEYDRLIGEQMEREPELHKWLTGGRVKAEDDIVRRRERGWDMVQRYITYMATSQERPWPYQGDDVAVEVPFTLELDGLEIQGFIDQVILWPDGRLTPRDLKSGSKRPDWPIQLAVYALALEQDYGIPPEYGDFYMLKDDKPDRPVDLTRYSRAKLARWFHNLDKAIRLGAFLPNPGDQCRRCSVQDHCPVNTRETN